MEDPGYEVHPLDRDYSDEAEPSTSKQLTMEQQFRRFAVAVFATGFVVLLLVAVILGSVQGSGAIESFGSVLHRFAMILILVGGLMIVVSYRLNELRRGGDLIKSKAGKAQLRSLGLLFVVNIVFFVLVLMVSASTSVAGRSIPLYVVLNGFLTIVGALIVTMIIWNRGPVQAFAVGVAASLAVSLTASGYWFSLLPYSARSGSGLLLARLATVQLSGFLCAAYVALLKDEPTKNTTPHATKSGQGPLNAPPNN